MASRYTARPIERNEIEALLSSLARARALVAAVSGGPDSTCLMHCLAAWRTTGERPPVIVATVDHGLRPDSGREARLVAEWARGLGLPHHVLLWRGDKPDTAVQETAREERYRLLVGLAHEVNASHVVTAHTVDDQAETVVMRLLRGTGVGGLGGMRPVLMREGITLARPFLDVPKARLLATCAARRWPYLDDPSNADPRFARARLRGRVMPLLAEEGLTPERLAILAERARRDADALDARALAVLAAIRLEDKREAACGERLDLDAARLAAEPDAVLLRVAARAIAAVLGPRRRPARLERFEARILGDLRGALDRGEALRLNLGGALLQLSAARRLTIRPEPPRRARPAAERTS